MFATPNFFLYNKTMEKVMVIQNSMRLLADLVKLEERIKELEKQVPKEFREEELVKLLNKRVSN